MQSTMQHAMGDAGAWRAELLKITLRVSVYLGVVACLPSMYMAVSTGLTWIAVLDATVLLSVFALYRGDTLPYRWRARLLCVAGYVLGLALLIAVGAFSVLFFVVCSVLATLLLGQRTGLFATVAGTLTITAIGVLGLTGPEVVMPTREFYATRWIVIALNFALVSTLLTMGIGAVLTALEGTLQAEIRTRRSLEQERALLRQSQKMEAVGQLAGGVAHDFNNLLTVIFGYCDVLRAHVAGPGEVAESVDAISDAAARAAALTRQLLAFSRQSMLKPKVLDLNATISETGRMLSRLIGEDIHFAQVFNPSIGKVRVDPGQLDQVLMNLAVNARDAMPLGGTLTITTAPTDVSAELAARLEGAPGPHVTIAVHDTGVGMTPEVQSHIFEPFFTTKGVGSGTGLGLAMVFGIVRQSGGMIDVESAPGRGSTFRIHLPVVQAPEASPEPPAAVPLHGTETVLLVEDDVGVRELAVASLRSHGYTVLTAPDGRAALDVAAAHDASIALLVTDVVMPRMSGPELAQQLTRSRPNVQVLYMSGYTDDAVVRQGVLHADVAFLQKPFTPHDLACQVRSVLDEARVAAASFGG